MIFETERLRLRPWNENDVESLHAFTKVPLVWLIAGWLVHISIEDRRQIIQDILSSDGIYAVTLKKKDA
ncbi:MAG: hypothetical protein RR297_03965 [Clostridia bacterium]